MNARSTTPSGHPVRRGLAILAAALIALTGAAVATPAYAAETTYTHADGATLTYDTEVAPGESIRISGTQWLAKPDRVDEGEEGSVIGLKLIDPAIGQLSRQELVDNPRLGEPISNATVWGAVWADSDGSFEIDLEWPDASNAVTDPVWEAGDTFTVQVLSGTLYSDEPGIDPSLRPDVSRTVALTITVADPAPAAPLAIATQPTAQGAANGASVSFAAAATGGVAPVTVQWQRSTSASASNPPAAYANLTAANTVDGSFAKPTLTVVAGQSTNANNRWYRAVFTDATGATVTTDAAKLSIIPIPTATTHPVGQTIAEGQTATFTAGGTSTVDMTVSWQANTTALPNGEPNDATWTTVPGATGTTLEVEGVDAAAQHDTFYRAVLTNVSGSAYSNPAQLRFVERLDTTSGVTVSAESYGPVQPNTPFSVSAPNAVVKGEPIVIEGTGYFATDGTTGSVANFMIDASYSGDPNTLSTTRDVVNPVTGGVFADKRSHGIVQANADGTWRIEIPWPDETNTTRDAAFFETNWASGSHHMVRILTGSLLTTPADYQRGISVRFTVVDEPTTAGPVVTTTGGTAEQGGDLWFALSGFEPEAAVAVELVDGAGTVVASAPFTIGADGNTANPDGQTYRRLVVPRDAAVAADYAVRVTQGGETLATSTPVAVTAATTRVYNPGDHAGGVEDLLVQRGGTWTFRAVAFEPGGTLTATAEIGGETVTLSGLGQIGATQHAWRLDEHGDTPRDVYTRVQLPSSVEPGELAVTFSDGTRSVTRVLTIEAPQNASVTVDESAVVGGTIRVTGSGFVHPNGEEGSTVAIKINDGAYSRVDGSTHQNRTIWWIVEADEHGSFSIDMPVPNGTTADAGDTLGSTPALAPGEGFTLRFLTGSLKPNDLSRTLQSAPFDIAAPADTTAPRVSGSVTGRTVTVTATDEGSGVAVVETRVDEGAWTAYEGPFEVPGTAGHRVEFRAADVAGNVSAIGSVTVAATAPTGALSASIVGIERSVLVGESVHGYGVVLTDAGGAAVRGVPVTFTVAGGVFATGAATATVSTNAAGIAIAPAASAVAPGTLVITANWGTGSTVLPSVHVSAPAPALSADVQAEAVAVAGKVVIEVSATNTSSEPATLAIKSKYGSKTFADVAPGATVSHGFKTYLGSVGAGSVTVTVSTASGSAQVVAEYAAR
ncbi:OmpL47-type beta-barrel domain-containing protein [Microbacterium sp. No. 7]|uniref:OmpL47-type beta-barrel domain-containing protein n=1 Tax=Microbacterium sp. No. 7 TaxID=1714373 RepID=UPI0006D001C7|nr:hypothetical protein [Microbacterium sp. No. 7]ALJ21657.1 hypothetical protein AOA12_17870 [Microbacterium sp. No. 7]